MKDRINALLKQSFIALFMLCLSLHVSAEKRYYFVADQDYQLPEGSVDYRWNGTDYTIEISQFWLGWAGRMENTLNQITNHQTEGKTGDEYLDFTTNNGDWWNFSLKKAEGSIDMTDVNDSWYIHFWLRTTIPIESDLSLTLYGHNGTSGKYSFNETLPAVKRLGEWVELIIPLSDFLDNVDNYSLDFSSAFEGNIFLVNGNTSGCILSFDDMYITDTLTEVEEPENDNLTVPADGIILTESKSYASITFEDNTSTLTIADGLNITAGEITVPVDATGDAPQIVLGANSKLTAVTYNIEKTVTSDNWSLLSVPFDYLTDDIKIKSTGENAIANDDVYIKKHTTTSHLGYVSNPTNIWSDVSTSTSIKTALTASSVQGISYAIALKMNPEVYPDGDVLVVTGRSVVLEGKDQKLTNVWATIENLNIENFNLTGSPFTGSYTGILKSPASSSRPKAQKGITTYFYNSTTDNYTANLPANGPATYLAYDAWFSQSYENISVPFTPDLTAGETYSITGSYEIILNNGVDKAQIIELENSNKDFEQNEDGVKLFGIKETTSSIYLLDNSNVKLSASAVPDVSDGSMKLGVKAGSTGEFTISLSAISNPNSLKIAITDASSGKTVVLDETGYTFNVDEIGYIENRFTLSFVENGLSRTNEDTKNPILTGVWANQDNFDNLGLDYSKLTTIDFTDVLGLTTLPAMENLNPNCLIYVSSESGITGNNIVSFDASTASAANIVLKDGFDFYNTREFRAEAISYERDFSAMNEDGWASICIPFAADMTGFKVKEFTNAETMDETTTVTFTTIQNDFAANTPYIINVAPAKNQSGSYQFSGNDQLIPTTPLEIASTTIDELTFKGTYDKISDATGLYLLHSDGSGFGLGSSTSYVPAFRAYITDSSSTNTRQFALKLEGEVTDIANEEVSTNELRFYSNNGILVIQVTQEQSIQIYTLDGRLVKNLLLNEGKNIISDLAKGIYVINNQKVVIK